MLCKQPVTPHREVDNAVTYRAQEQEGECRDGGNTIAEKKWTVNVPIRTYQTSLVFRHMSENAFGLKVQKSVQILNTNLFSFRRYFDFRCWEFGHSLYLVHSSKSFRKKVLTWLNPKCEQCFQFSTEILQFPGKRWQSRTSAWHRTRRGLWNKLDHFWKFTHFALNKYTVNVRNPDIRISAFLKCLRLLNRPDFE